jgi:probable rRNA maturation factor
MPSEERLVLFRRAPAGLPRAALERFAHTLQERVTGGRAFQCLVTDDRELRRLNATFLDKDYPTDVLSFPEAGVPEGDGRLGEVAISAERAREQAARFGHNVEQEIYILMLHGVLHLCGMDHEKDRGRMRREESRWRRGLGLPAGLIERVRA